MIKTAMIFCAGLGTRMRPLTDTIPKPLAELAGKPIILHILEQLYNSGITKIIINLYYKGNMIEDIVMYWNQDKNLNIIFLYEDQLYGNGGSLKNAYEFIKNDELIFVTNSDVLFLTKRNLINHMYDNIKADRQFLLYLARLDKVIEHHTHDYYIDNIKYMYVCGLIKTDILKEIPDTHFTIIDKFATDKYHLQYMTNDIEYCLHLSSEANLLQANLFYESVIL